MLKKIGNFVFILFNLALLAMGLYGASHNPQSPYATLVFVITTAVVLYIILDIAWRINNILVDREIRRYINSGFNPNSVKKY